MLAARGFAVTNEEIEEPLEGFIERFSEDPVPSELDYTICSIEDVDDKITVMFPDDRKLNAASLRKVLDVLDGRGCTRGILVVDDKLTAYARRALAVMRPKYIVEAFNQNDLLVDITEHFMVPEHELLSEDETTALLARFRTELLQLPRIRHDDPISRYFGAERGQVFKVTRVDDEGNRSIAYRVVV